MEAKASGRVKFLRERDILRRPQFHTVERFEAEHDLTLPQRQWERHRRGGRDTERMRKCRNTDRKEKQRKEEMQRLG